MKRVKTPKCENGQNAKMWKRLKSKNVKIVKTKKWLKQNKNVKTVETQKCENGQNAKNLNW